MRECAARRFVAGALAAWLAAAGAQAWSQSGDQPGTGTVPQSGQQQAGSPPAPRATAPAPPGKETPRPQDLEPGVNTSATPPSSTPASPGNSQDASGANGEPASAPSSRPADSADGAAGKTSTASRSRSAQKPTAPPAEPRASATPSGKAHDKIELDTTQITGNRELPKVLYIVPWKRSDLGDLVGKPVNSLLDEVLTPVDRDVFRRQNRYYDALKPDSAQDAAAAGAGQKP
ncbi:MAG TPA: hypothetical protein VFO44_02175 [Steroidobacteraceae bacterium]|nr:hypothetical protein [Steroidobacteraceae bacterium]